MRSSTASILLLPLLAATPALSQQQEEASDPVFNLPRTGQPQSDSTRQGPELDVFRGAPVQLPPPVVVPTITPPPAATAPQPAPQAAPATEPQGAAPMPTPRSAPDRPTPSPPQTAAPEPQFPAATPPPATPQPQTPAPTPLRPAPIQRGEDSAWPWIAAALVLLAGIAAVLLRRRTRHSANYADREMTEDNVPPPTTPAIPRPAPRPAAPPPPPAGPRPWIDLSMEVRAARLSLMGVTIDYALTLHNRGDQVAEDILVRTLIANADSGQEASLEQFFAGSTGLPTHSVVTVGAGESHSLRGELRLLPDQIRPIQMDRRALLIPLAAFDAQYRWVRNGGDLGIGRTGRAFIVGQEQSPPAERLSPFRTDLGPRQYPTPGSRATALSLAS